MGKMIPTMTKKDADHYEDCHNDDNKMKIKTRKMTMRTAMTMTAIKRRMTMTKMMTKMIS